MRQTTALLNLALILGLAGAWPDQAVAQRRRGGQGGQTSGSAVARQGQPPSGGSAAGQGQPRSGGTVAHPGQPRSGGSAAGQGQPRSGGTVAHPGQPRSGGAVRPSPGPGSGPGYRPGATYRPGPGYDRRGPGYYGRGSYDPRYIRFSAGFGWGLYPFYWDPYWYSAWGGHPGYWWNEPAYYGGGYGYDEGSLKLSVTPKDAEVFVDQQFAGVVDDFDGFLQSLKVEAGGHTITLYREGYRTVSREIDFRAGETFRLTFSMVALQPGEGPEPRPVQAAVPERLTRSAWREPADTGVAEPPVPAAPREPQSASPVERPAAASFGALAIRVQPAGAELLIDGEAWQGADGTSRLVVQLPPGVHRVEIRRAGSETFRTEVRIEPGETTTLNVSLSGLDWH